MLIVKSIDRAKCIGDNILKSVIGKKVVEHTFRKKEQVVTLAAIAIQVNNEAIQIDSLLLFQRLVSVGMQTEQQLNNILKFELCSYPPALFEGKHVLRPANKPHLGFAAIRKYGTNWLTAVHFGWWIFIA